MWKLFVYYADNANYSNIISQLVWWLAKENACYAGCEDPTGLILLHVGESYQKSFRIYFILFYFKYLPVSQENKVHHKNNYSKLSL